MRRSAAVCTVNARRNVCRCRESESECHCLVFICLPLPRKRMGIPASSRLLEANLLVHPWFHNRSKSDFWPENDVQ